MNASQEHYTSAKRGIIMCVIEVQSNYNSQGHCYRFSNFKLKINKCKYRIWFKNIYGLRELVFKIFSIMDTIEKLKQSIEKPGGRVERS